MANIADTLAERGKVYGSFKNQAHIGQDLKRTMYRYTAATGLAPDQCEALEMICTKMARIINGDPNYIDNWHDIAGYATLVADRLRAEKTNE